jgi:predicted RNase H-related nuclease YkuK (DUF458 family)
VRVYQFRHFGKWYPSIARGRKYNPLRDPCNPLRSSGAVGTLLRMNGFRRMADHRPIQLLDHVLEIIARDPGVEVLVGSDSQNHERHTIYTTTVVLRYHRNGAQVLYRRERTERIRDLWTRLWGEVERSLEVARTLSDVGGIRISRIDMDINSDPRFASHKLHTTAVGYVRSQGYETRTKPELLIATWAANLLCQ